ncbi:hypothetical protein IFR05_015843 [Cadophora sp. M221]|nr:hypothetical protein IFR05_015843 [Cadophora sp. M221]
MDTTNLLQIEASQVRLPAGLSCTLKRFEAPFGVLPAFLDSADKDNDGDSHGRDGFHYNWITKVDDDGTWSLVHCPAETDTDETLNLSAFKDSREMQEKVFGCLLRAIYTRPYTLDNYPELALLSTFAGFYQALPVVSNTVFSSICKSPIFARILPGRATSIIITAAKLQMPSCSGNAWFTWSIHGPPHAIL